jgi:hypothetical protein
MKSLLPSPFTSIHLGTVKRKIFMGKMSAQEATAKIHPCEHPFIRSPILTYKSPTTNSMHTVCPMACYYTHVCISNE